MKLTKAEEFRNLLNYWCGRLKLAAPIRMTRDNRMGYPLALDGWKDKKLCLKYNSRRLGKRQKCVWVEEMFHEIGHLINNLPYETEEQQIISEREAEKFALRMLKRSYPRLYKKYIRLINRNQSLKKLEKCDPIHYKAFKPLRRYNEFAKKKV